MDSCREQILSRTTGPPPCILVVDDEELVRDLLAHFLETKGYRVLSAGDGRHALEIFRRQPVDLVLSDVYMPGLSGLQLLAAVKDLNPRVPVVLISGRGEVPTVVQALKAGAENFLTKPLDLELLARVVNRSLQLARIRPQAAEHHLDLRQITQISTPSHADYICEVIYQIALSAVAVGFAEHDLDNNLKLALVEAVTNAMEHGNRWDVNKRVEVEAVATPELLEVRVRDQGEGFDFSHLPDPTQEENLLCERGRGIFLMRSIMDQVVFVPPGNQVILSKRRLPRDRADSNP